MNSVRLQSLGAGLRLALVGSLTLLLVACGGSGKRPVSADSAEANEKPEDVVKMRAIKRWELLIDKRFEEAYDLLSPGYREVRSKEDYVKIMRARPLQWTRVHFQDATCAEESCAVNIEVSAQFEMPVMRVGTVDTLTVVTENWVSSDGEWYLVPAADR